MKVLLTTLAFALSFTSLTASIDPFDMVVLSDPTSSTVVVRSTVPMAHPGTLVLRDERGQQLYSIEISEGGFISKRFPFKYLPTGKYLIILTDTHGRTSLPFSSDKGIVTYSPREGWKTMFPKVNLDEDKLLIVNYPAYGGHPVAVSLRQTNGQAVFKEVLDGDVAIKKAYQLNELSAGSYEFTIEQRTDVIHRTSITLR